MIKMTQSLRHWLFTNYPKEFVMIEFGHLELFTPEMQKEKEAEATTLKIKAAGYDVIKGIVGESFENVWEPEDTVTMIDGVLRMEEAVMKTLI